ncbi:UAA transporter [Colletotrichum plurivorum]|uniref:UDP-galactose transporter homolog 1 n=1 Tax=Colletotrichum plurivorum TaxID=2175906 RepID=A0A8H6NMC1_9PEZI|nr:UAA transporter [Colletotrichum plurivorum]
MARSKQATPVRRQASSEYFSKQDLARTPSNGAATQANGKTKAAPLPMETKEAGALQILIAVGGIVTSLTAADLLSHSLTWAYLQEKLTTTPYGPESKPEVFKYPVFLNTIQSLFAATTGFLYLYFSSRKAASLPPVFPSSKIVAPLALVAVTSSLASPFGYASLSHIDYITFLLAKSCKLVPVMLLHTTLFGKRYPLYKYLVVAGVTAGVAVFTLHSGSKKKKSVVNPDANMPWGMLLLSINLLFDGLTNSTQDYIFSTFKGYTGPQMMCANNLMSTAVTLGYLVLSPWLVHTGLGEYLGMDVAGSAGELKAALAFMARYPAVWGDVLGFAACGAVGQVFIFYTLATFSSVLLVTVTVTRKMVTMALSVFAFGHSLSNMQWLGVSLVFGAIGAEARIATKEKQAKEAAKRAAAAGKTQ